MAKSNRDRIGEIMDALKAGLGQFVLREAAESGQATQQMNLFGEE